MTLHEYRVGAPYIPGRTFWPEMGEYNYRQGAHELRLFLLQPGGQEVTDVRRGRAEFALVEIPPILFLLYRFGRIFRLASRPAESDDEAGL